MNDDKPDGPDPAITVDFLDVRVWDADGEMFTYSGIDGYEMSPDYIIVSIKRRGLAVALHRHFLRISVMIKFKDGSWIDEEQEGAPPTDVGLGVQVSAVGGRTA